MQEKSVIFLSKFVVRMHKSGKGHSRSLRIISKPAGFSWQASRAVSTHTRRPGSASRTGRSARDRNMGRYPLPTWKARYAGPGALPQCLNRRAGALLGNIRAHGSLWPPRLALSSILQSMNGFIIRACGRFVKDFPAYGGQPVVNRV